MAIESRSYQAFNTYPAVTGTVGPTRRIDTLTRNVRILLSGSSFTVQIQISNAPITGYEHMFRVPEDSWETKTTVTAADPPVDVQQPVMWVRLVVIAGNVDGGSVAETSSAEVPNQSDVQQATDLAQAAAALSALLQTTRATLVAGTLNVNVGMRLIDEHGPLKARAAVGAEVADNGLTYALPGGLIAEREDDGSPTQADWYGIPEDTPGQTARWQAAVDGAYRRRVKRLDVGRKSYVLDGIIQSKASFNAPDTQFTLSVGTATSSAARISLVAEGDPVIYTDAQHLIASSLPLTSFAPGMDILKDQAVILSALGAFAHQQMQFFSSLPSTGRANGAFDETYDRNDCVIVSPDGSLNVALSNGYDYPASVTSATEWSSGSTYTWGDVVKLTVGGTAYKFVATYPSGPGVTYHGGGTIGAVSPNQAVADTLSGVTAGNFGNVRVWRQIYRFVKVWPRQRSATLIANVRVSGTHSTATDVAVGGVLTVLGRPGVTMGGVLDTDNVNTKVDSLMRFDHVAGLNIVAGTRLSGATSSGLGYGMLASNVSRAVVDSVIAVGCRDGWAARHGNNVEFRGGQYAHIDDHYGFDYVIRNVQFSNPMPISQPYAVTFSGRNLRMQGCAGRNTRAMLGLRSDVAQRGGRVTLDDVEITPFDSGGDNGMVFGKAVPRLTVPGFDFGVPYLWPEVIHLNNCHIATPQDGSSGSRSWVQLLMDGSAAMTLPREIRVTDCTNAQNGWPALGFKFYALPTRVTGTARVTAQNTRVIPLVNPVTDGVTTLVDMQTAWLARTTQVAEFDLRRCNIYMAPDMSMPVTYRFREGQVYSWTQGDTVNPPNPLVSPVILDGQDTIFGRTDLAQSAQFGPFLAYGKPLSTFRDCDFPQVWNNAWLGATVLRAMDCRYTAGDGSVVVNAPRTYVSSGGGITTRRLPGFTSGTAKTYRLARLNAAAGVYTDLAIFAGRVTGFGSYQQSGKQSWGAQFAFGPQLSGTSNYDLDVKPAYSALGEGGGDMRLYRTADGYLDVYLLMPAISLAVTLEYVLYNGSEPSTAWTMVDPPGDATLLWTSATGLGQAWRANGPVRPGVTTIALLPVATAHPNALMAVSNPAASKGRVVYSDGTAWRYVSDDSAV